MVYIVQGSQFSHKRHLNQIRKQLSDDTDSTPQEEVIRHFRHSDNSSNPRMATI